MFHNASRTLDFFIALFGVTTAGLTSGNSVNPFEGHIFQYMTFELGKAAIVAFASVLAKDGIVWLYRMIFRKNRHAGK